MNIKELKEAATKASPGGLAVNRLEAPMWDRVGYPMADGFNTLAHFLHTQDAEYFALANPSTILSLIERYQQMEEALREVMEWIRNWSPDFTNDDEWQDTEAKINAALSPDTQRNDP